MKILLSSTQAKSDEMEILVWCLHNTELWHLTGTHSKNCHDLLHRQTEVVKNEKKNKWHFIESALNKMALFRDTTWSNLNCHQQQHSHDDDCINDIIFKWKRFDFESGSSVAHSNWIDDSKNWAIECSWRHYNNTAMCLNVIDDQIKCEKRISKEFLFA